MSVTTLPVTADLFGGGKPIEDMPKLVGWTTFTVEHAIYGLVLGIAAAIAGRMALMAESKIEARAEERQAA